MISIEMVGQGFLSPEYRDLIGNVGACITFIEEDFLKPEEVTQLFGLDQKKWMSYARSSDVIIFSGEGQTMIYGRTTKSSGGLGFMGIHHHEDYESRLTLSNVDKIKPKKLENALKMHLLKHNPNGRVEDITGLAELKKYLTKHTGKR